MASSCSVMSVYITIHRRYGTGRPRCSPASPLGGFRSPSARSASPWVLREPNRPAASRRRSRSNAPVAMARRSEFASTSGDVPADRPFSKRSATYHSGVVFSGKATLRRTKRLPHRVGDLLLREPRLPHRCRPLSEGLHEAISSSCFPSSIPGGRHSDRHVGRCRLVREGEPR